MPGLLNMQLWNPEALSWTTTGPAEEAERERPHRHRDAVREAWRMPETRDLQKETNW